ncbi:MAG: S41 family peptidase, partial [Cyclobacteriaceae bacterium]
LEETPLVATKAAEFQPQYSPDGKKVAYLEDRTTLKEIDLATKASKVLLSADHNYSYADGDMSFAYSPDGKWMAAGMLGDGVWIGEVGVINTATGDLRNITNSGYSDDNPKWSKDGTTLYWEADRDGLKAQNGNGSETDIYAISLNQKAYDEFKLNKEEYDVLKDKAGKDDKKDKEEEIKPVRIEFENLDKRKSRLTVHSSRMSDAVLSEDGESLYYLARFEKGLDLWVTKPRNHETKLLTKLGANNASILLDKKGESLFVLADGKPYKIKAENGDKKSISFKGEMELKKSGEFAYIFEHAWKQVQDKFYVKDLHEVNWDQYKSGYSKFLPHINNNRDFAEMLSEMLGELNASHTGCRYRPDGDTGDETPSLGLFFDENYTGNGLKVVEVLKDGPADKAELNIKPGAIIEQIDGTSITSSVNYYSLLNRKTGNNVLLSVLDPASKSKREVVIKPISRGDENNLLYQRWVDNRRKDVEEASGGKVGYVHVRGMNDASFRTVIDEALGLNASKESLIVDTRSNGGGWLHDDLATFLSGTKYMEMVPRSQRIGTEPQQKWSKPSAVIVGESNYSDAHLFPYAYRAMGIGKIVGMPVPGTGTAVWWEGQIDPTLVFGIPQVGMIDVEGDYLENKQLEPDIKIKNSYEMLAQGKDEQLLRTVELLLNEPKEKPKDVTLPAVEGRKGQK